MMRDAGMYVPVVGDKFKARINGSKHWSHFTVTRLSGGTVSLGVHTGKQYYGYRSYKQFAYRFYNYTDQTYGEIVEGGWLKDREVVWLVKNNSDQELYNGYW